MTFRVFSQGGVFFETVFLFASSLLVCLLSLVSPFVPRTKRRAAVYRAESFVLFHLYHLTPPHERTTTGTVVVPPSVRY